MPVLGSERRSNMIIGAHSIIYSRDGDADRAFLRDVLGFPHVDVGEGWLIFGLPPSEVAVHPGEENGVHELYLMTDDVEALVAEMTKRGVGCDPISNQGWGMAHPRHAARRWQARHLPTPPRPSPADEGRARKTGGQEARSRKKSEAAALARRWCGRARGPPKTEMRNPQDARLRPISAAFSGLPWLAGPVAGSRVRAPRESW